MKRVLIIDGHNFLFKSFAVPFKFNSKKGTPLHVVTTFLSLLRRSLLIVKAESLTVVFDSQTARNNSLLSSEYKANRKNDYSAEKDSPFSHLPLIKKVLDLLGIQWIEHADYEADDVVASISQSLQRQHNCKVTIASTDSDFFQLLSSNVSILRIITKKNTVLCEQKWFKKRFGFEPSLYVNFKSLVGDPIDNVKGISGIGPKRAALIIKGKKNWPLSQEELSLLRVNNAIILLKDDISLTVNVQKNTRLLLKLPNKKVFALCNF